MSACIHRCFPHVRTHESRLGDRPKSLLAGIVFLGRLSSLALTRRIAEEDDGPFARYRNCAQMQFAVALGRVCFQCSRFVGHVLPGTMWLFRLVDKVQIQHETSMKRGQRSAIESKMLKASEAGNHTGNALMFGKNLPQIQITSS